jgi:hypothetical protein
MSQQELLSRAVAILDQLGIEYMMSSPEDTILAKLDWACKCGGSEKQFNDALRIYELQGSALDTAYLNTWATQLGVEDLWIELRARAEPLQTMQEP